VNEAVKFGGHGWRSARVPGLPVELRFLACGDLRVL
jgi:hypothetical protein